MIIKKSNLCKCSLTAGSWHIESNIMYCNSKSKNELTLYYTVNMATVLYQFEEKQNTEGIKHLSLYTDPINFDTREQNLINEEDDDVLKHASSALSYEELMKDIGTKKYQSKAELAMPFTHAEQWLNCENFLANFYSNYKFTGNTFDTIDHVHSVQILWIQISISEIKINFGRTVSNR